MRPHATIYSHTTIYSHMRHFPEACNCGVWTSGRTAFVSALGTTNRVAAAQSSLSVAAAICDPRQKPREKVRLGFASAAVAATQTRPPSTYARYALGCHRAVASQAACFDDQWRNGAWTDERKTSGERRAAPADCQRSRNQDIHSMRP